MNFVTKYSNHTIRVICVEAILLSLFKTHVDSIFLIEFQLQKARQIFNKLTKLFFELIM
jgi:hypothetical protein